MIHEQKCCHQPSAAHSCVLLNHLDSFWGGMFKLTAKFDVDSFLYLLSYFECYSRSVHTLTQQHLPPTLTSTVKSSLFVHVHSSPLSLAARYIDVTQTVLIMLRMAGLSLDRSCTFSFTRSYIFLSFGV